MRPASRPDTLIGEMLGLELEIDHLGVIAAYAAWAESLGIQTEDLQDLQTEEGENLEQG